MTTTLLNLGQAAPSAVTATDLYTVPSATSAVVSSIIIANRSATPDKFRVSIRVAGAGATNKQYLYYDTAIAGNDTFIATVGITLATTDVITVYSTNGTLSFNLSGQQNS